MGTVVPSLALRPVTTLPATVLFPLEVSVPPTSTTPFQFVLPLMVALPVMIKVPLPSGIDALPFTRMTGHAFICVEFGQLCGGMMYAGVSAFLFTIPSQSMWTASLAWLALVPRDCTGGDPSGTDE